MKPSIVLPPPGEFPREDLYSKRRYRRCQYLGNQFWIRWRSEYLQILQVRSKWQKSSKNIKIGDLVLLKDEHLPRLSWHLCKVKEVFTGSDGKVRSALLLLGSRDKSETSTLLKRPVQKMELIMESWVK